MTSPTREPPTSRIVATGCGWALLTFFLVSFISSLTLAALIERKILPRSAVLEALWFPLATLATIGVTTLVVRSMIRTRAKTLVSEQAPSHMRTAAEVPSEPRAGPQLVTAQRQASIAAMLVLLIVAPVNVLAYFWLRTGRPIPQIFQDITFILLAFPTEFGIIDQGRMTEMLNNMTVGHDPRLGILALVFFVFAVLCGGAWFLMKARLSEVVSRLGFARESEALLELQDRAASGGTITAVTTMFSRARRSLTNWRTERFRRKLTHSL